MDLQVSSLYDQKTLQTFAQFCMFRGRYYRLKRVVTFGLYLIAIPLILTMLLLSGGSQGAFVLFAALLFLALFLLLNYFVIPKLTFKRMGGEAAMSTNEYHFTDEKLSVRSISRNYEGESDFEYKAIQQVFETASAFYLFLSRRNAFIVSKAAMEPETTSGLRAFLAGKLGEKAYILCK